MLDRAKPPKPIPQLRIQCLRGMDVLNSSGFMAIFQGIDGGLINKGKFVGCQQGMGELCPPLFGIWSLAFDDRLIGIIDKF